MIKKLLITLIGTTLGIAAISFKVTSTLIIPAAIASWYLNNWNLFWPIIGYGCLLFFSVFIVIPLAYGLTLEAIRSYTNNKHQSARFTKVSLKILHFIEMPIYVEKIEFINTVNKRKSTIKINNNILRNSIQHDSLPTSIWERNNKAIMSIFNALNGDQFIPTETDKFCLRYYSFIEETYYNIEGVFSTQEYAEKSLAEDGYRHREMGIFIKPNAVVELLNYKNQSVSIALKSKIIPLSEKKKDSLLEAFLEQRMTKENFSALLNKIRTSGRLQKNIDMHSKTFRWKTSYTGPDEVVGISITDFCQQHYSTAYPVVDSISQKLLPSAIIIHLEQKNNKRNYGIRLQLDKEKLYQTVQQLTAENPDELISFSVIIKDANKEAAQVMLGSIAQTLEFADCEATFNEYMQPK